MGTSKVELKDVTGKKGARNDGMVKSKAMRGQTVLQAYGKDTSAVVGGKDDEQMETMQGGVNNLSHSLGQSDRDND